MESSKIVEVALISYIHWSTIARFRTNWSWCIRNCAWWCLENFCLARNSSHIGLCLRKEWNFHLVYRFRDCFRSQSYEGNGNFVNRKPILDYCLCRILEENYSVVNRLQLLYLWMKYFADQSTYREIWEFFMFTYIKHYHLITGVFSI